MVVTRLRPLVLNFIVAAKLPIDLQVAADAIALEFDVAAVLKQTFEI